MGYWAAPEEIVITNIIGPGPGATHSKRKFKPDHSWQTQQIVEIYNASKFYFSYLGDWHSHPNFQDSGLSWLDRRALRKIASYKPARAPVPIMAIIEGGSPWNLKIWSYKLLDFKLFFLGKKTKIKNIRFYE